jgi:hypothetical protein
MGALKLPENPRAKRLFGEVDARYQVFAGRLPESLGRMARLRRTYLGSPSDDPFQGIADLNPVLAGTPWMFWELFEHLDDSQFVTIAEGGALFVLASILLDHIIDRQADRPEAATLLHQALFSQGIECLRTALPTSPGFWSHFERLEALHLAGLAAELDSQAETTRMRDETFIQMAHGKVSPIVVTLAALAEAAGRPEALPQVEASLNHIAVASQLLDDIGDWREDLEAGHVTYFLTRIPGYHTGHSKPSDDVDAVQAAIDEDWLDVDYLHVTLDWLRQSVAAVGGLECPGWLEYVESYRQLTDEHLTVAVARHLVRVLRPIVAGSAF